MSDRTRPRSATSALTIRPALMTEPGASLHPRSMPDGMRRHCCARPGEASVKNFGQSETQAPAGQLSPTDGPMPTGIHPRPLIIADRLRWLAPHVAGFETSGLAVTLMMFR